MASSKHNKKRPFSLSLSQSTGMESSKIKKKKKVSSQDCEFFDSTSMSLVSKVEDNPKRKLVEDWLENSNHVVDVRSSIESTDENSQETVLLDANSRKTIDEDEKESPRENVVAKGDVNKQTNVDKLADVEENVVKEVDSEGNPLAKETVEENPVNGEPEMCSGSATEEEPLLQCPLCWKNFERSQTQAAHLKACASANGLTTRQLIDAVELHKKQLAERRKLGLFPMVPHQAASKKSAPKKVEGQSGRKGRQPKDKELELALALSLSLAHREEKQESLNAFGFTKKSNGSKKAVPLLLSRTQAERERLITEKVSIVLLEEPGPGDSQPRNSSQDVHPTVQSTQLQEWCDEDQPLWKKSFFSPSQSDAAAFYVSALGHIIVPSKAEVGANLRHISQLPGRLNTPKKSEQPKEKSGDDSSVSECHSVTNTLSLSKLEQDVKAKHLSDWACMFKNSSMSDVSVYVLGGLAIPAHKLVLAVRCPQVLHDVTSQRNDVTGLHVDVIVWSDISHDAALCFLEYVYYGSIRSIHTLREDMSGLRWLANRYEAKDLINVLSYFEGKKRAVKSILDEASVCSPTPDPAPVTVSSKGSLHSQLTVPIVTNIVENESDEDMFNDEPENKKASDHSIYSHRTVIPQGRTQSPDIFSDDYELALSNSVKSGISREDTAARKLSFDSSLNQVTPGEDRSSTTLMGKPKSSEHLSPERKSYGMSISSELEKSTATPKRLSPTNVIDLSPSSDLPEFDIGSQKAATTSQHPVFPADDDIVILSDDEDTDPVEPKQQDIRSLSTESLKSTGSPSADKDAPYISPVWNGFDDMPCDIYMGSNWNDEPVNGISPIRGSTTRDKSPERRNVQDTSPVRFDIKDTPPRANIVRNCPERSNFVEISSSRGSSPENSPARASSGGISSGRGGYQSSLGANKIHSVSDTASSEDESAPGSAGCDMLNDSMNALFQSSVLERVEKEHITGKRTKKKGTDDSGTESGRVTPMKNYRGMSSSEIKVELEKFGLKPMLGKRKGIRMLEYIYNELHPWVPIDGSSSNTRQPLTQRLNSSEPCSSNTTQKVDSPSSSSSTSSSDEGLSDVELDDSDSGMALSHQGAKRLSASELAEVVRKHIEKDKALHRRILEYEPIIIEHLHSDIKTEGYKVKIADLMAYLGEKCINYRSLKTQSQTRKNRKQNGNQRKKRRPNGDPESSGSNVGLCS